MAAITLTFDNLGEAAALERGTWTGATPLGADPSVTVALPRLLDELERHALRGTFCVEAINCDVYPDAVRAIAARGHELAIHGWRHEAWSELDPARERELLSRARDAFGALGLSPAGFRPPGGMPAPADPRLLADHGIEWWSPVKEAGIDGSADGPLRTVPFSWEHVDAYLLMERFAELRARRGDPRAGLDPAGAEARLRAALDAGHELVLVLHPFLMLEEAWWEQVRRLLETVAGRVAAGELECRTAGRAALG
ncbi:MAG TPA: polysaccharide deacetylase family protein [Solirubrobacteraceae bacterium]|nr:polysaccharide deacetylase family protein [Solirubrobacteraceae bacterium]